MTAIPFPPQLPAARTDHLPRPLGLSMAAEVRNRDLDPVGQMWVRFEYLPHDPYALHLHISDVGDLSPAPHEVTWVGSRDAFVAAGLHGVPLAGLDMTVQPVTVTRQRLGEPERDVPSLRVGLFEVDHAQGMSGLHSGHVVWLDLDLGGPLTQYLRQITRVVQPGTEGRYLSIDRAIAQLLGR